MNGLLSSLAGPGRPRLDALADAQAALDAVRAVQETQRLLRDPDALVRWALSFDGGLAAAVLAGIKGAAAAGVREETYLELLRHPDREVRLAAIALLGRRREDDASPDPAGPAAPPS
jgi:hypothetical protein